MKKKGVFFSTDALIALVIIFLVVLISYPILTSYSSQSEIHYDSLTFLSSVEVGELDNVYVQNMISSGIINNTNISLLEQIGAFYVTNSSLAREFSENVFSDVDFENENFGIWYEGTLVFSSNSSSWQDARNVETTRRIISGLKEGESVTGFSARALLSNSLRQEYFYFGGYVGDGNLSLTVDYSGTINSSQAELAINEDFDVYVNDVFVGSYSASPSDFEPSVYDIPVGQFSSGSNTVEFRGQNLHISGGFVKIVYDSEVQYEQPVRYYFPGIDGLINLYDSFYVPGDLDSLDIYLHYENDFTPTFLNVGNVTVYNSTSLGEVSVSLDDSTLSSLLDYNSLGRETIPLRLGMENVSYVGITRDIDVVSVTDISGSMCDCSQNGIFGICSYDEALCGSHWSCSSGYCTGGIDDAREANQQFIDIILNNSGNRVGLVGYESTAATGDFHTLSNNNASLQAEVDSWVAAGGTCICCGVNRAVDDLVANSNLSKFRSILVMSDGVANEQCGQQGTGSSTGDAIESACDAYQDEGIVVYTLGFGNNVDEVTLQSMAACGNGTYTYANVDELSEIYEQVASQIVATYSEQTLGILGDVRTRFYPDSYIEFGYSNSSQAYGLIITSQKDFDDSLSGNFFVPSDVQVLETKIASYSGARWTDHAEINGNEFYDLSHYGGEYLSLGDPYFVNIPVSLISVGDNWVNLTTGVSLTNSTVGSDSNKIIYTYSRNASSFTEILTSATGCNWEIQFEDSTSINVDVPVDYSGGESCVYNSTSQGVENSNDAFQLAVLELLEKLDLDSDGMIDVVFGEQDLAISVDEIQGIPFTWSTEVQARIWY